MLNSEDLKDYKLLSIIGCQNTGKSTLLNHLFETDFKVLAEQQSGRTTLGIDLFIDSKHKIIIIDNEGSDSNARSDFRTFEKKTLLFNLAVSQATMFNIKADEIKRESVFSELFLKLIF
jgi:protein SEY1